MGQVPQNVASESGKHFRSSLIYGVVGDGRMARHFSHYLSLKQIPFKSWTRRSAESPEVALDGCDVVLLLMSDGAIEGFLSSHPALAGKKCVHFSGALVTPLASGIHPLMSFGAELYDLATYESIHFIGEEGREDFTTIFPALKNPYFSIPSQKKALYHALCVMSGNFTVMLWQKMFAELHQLGVPESAAIPYLKQISANLITDPARALTGPLVRGDHATLQRNIDALEGDPFQGIYRAFVRAYSPEILTPTPAKEVSPYDHHP